MDKLTAAKLGTSCITLGIPAMLFVTPWLVILPLFGIGCLLGAGSIALIELVFGE